MQIGNTSGARRNRSLGLIAGAAYGILHLLLAVGSSAQSPTVALPGTTATTAVLDGTNLVLVERTVPAGHMELFLAYDGTYRNPIVVVEGLDPTNDTFPADVYAMLNTWGGLDMVRAAGRSIWVVDFGDGGGALTANAGLVSYAVEAAANWGALSDAEVDVLGISMGGVVSRYALAADEETGGGSDGLVRLFVSGDSPQQGANGPPSLQEIILFSGDPELTPLLGCDAALSMLYTSVRSCEDNGCFLGALPSSTDWTGSSAAHDWFYDTLNALNGDGYPHKSRNVAVANGSLNPQPHSVGDPIYTARTYLVFIGRVQLCSETYGAYPYDVAPGSLGEDFAPGNIRQDNFELDEHFVATFIPTESALDMRDGYSMFDRTLSQQQSVNHSVITAETTDFILEEVLGPQPRYNPKYLPDDANATLYGWIVTAVFQGMFYAESPDRLSGMLVVSNDSVQEGDVVTVRGTMSLLAGERRVLATSVTVDGSAQVPGPLGLSNLALGGGPIGPFTPGITGASGLNNVGLLVRTWGYVISADADHFHIDDGSGVNVKCLVPAGVTLPGVNDCVSVTGISSCETVGEETYRLLRFRSQEDIVAF